MNKNILLNVYETAGILSISSARCYDLIAKGILPAVRLGRQIRIDPETLTAWINNGGQTLSEVRSKES